MSAKSVCENRSLNFVAIDFETANSNRYSICSVGLVRVVDGQPVEQCHLYVRPEPFYFDPVNVSIHGITEDDVKKAPRFSELWPKLYCKITGPLVAHNAAFDMSALRYALDAARIPYPELDYFCTRVISKVTWPGHPTCALDYVAELLGIGFKHHNAEEDARACADIARAACEKVKAQSLYAMEELLEIHKGSLFPGGYCSCGGARTYFPRFTSEPTGHVERVVVAKTECDADHPFLDKAFVFTGAMTSMTREKAVQEVVNRGGTYQDSVTATTNFLVLGEKGYAGYRSGQKSGKTTKAEKLIQKGQRLEILSERDFLRLL